MKPHDKDKLCPRALIVDDDPDHAHLLADALTTYYQVGPNSRITCEYTARDALAQPLGEYDVILLDLHMPDMDGLAMLERVLGRADVPVIFVTGEQDLTIAAQAVEAGAQDYVVKHGDYLLAIPAIVQKNISLHRIKLEHDRLQMRLQWMLQELKQKNEQLEASMKQLKTMATTDPLTGLNNRRYFNEQLRQKFAEALRYEHDLSCVMLDLDHYKQFNDTLGHQKGDELLQVVAEEIRAALRESDIAARYGGDEFILLLPHSDAEAASSVAERIRNRLARNCHPNKRLRFPVTLSIGIASTSEDHPNSDEGLVSMADRALYRAKETGRDRIVTFTDLREATSPTSSSAPTS